MNNPLLIDFLYYSIERTVLGFICYIPFWNHLRVYRWVIYISIPLGVPLLCAVITFVNFPPLVNIFVFCGASLVFYIMTIDAFLGKKMFVFMIVMNYATIIYNSVLFFSYTLWPEAYSSNYNWYEIGILCLVLAVTAPILGVVIWLRIRPILGQPSPSSIWKLMWVIPVVFVMIILLFAYITDTETKGSILFITATMILMIGSFMVYYFLLLLFNGFRKSAMMEVKVRMTQSQLAKQHEQYEMIQDTIDRMRMARHDMHHRLNILSDLIRNKDYASLEEYVVNYKESIPEGEKRYCDNRSVDAMISYFNYKANKSGIIMEINVTVPATGDPKYDSEISIIFGNLLENSIDAVQSIDDKRIELTCDMLNKYLVIRTVNRFDGNWKKSGETFLSTKHEGYGLGIESIKKIASEHGGTTEFNIDNDVFKASIIIEAKEMA